jgi:parallel beta-helix repeat protein
MEVPMPTPTFDVLKYKAVPNSGQDDTAHIQAALDAADGSGGTVVFPAGVFRIDATKGLFLRNKTTLQMDPKTSLWAFPNHAESYSILTCQDISGSAIKGGTIAGDRSAHTGTTGEWGMGITIKGACQGLTLFSLTLRECWGDGLYIAGGSNLFIKSLVCDHNRRQGVSIVNGCNIQIVNSQFINTDGTLPAYGLDLEPNQGCEIRNVQIESCLCENNSGGGISSAVPFANTGKASLQNVILQDSTLQNNGFKSIDGKQPGLAVANMQGFSALDCIIKGNAENGISVYGQSKQTRIEGCTVDSNKKHGIEIYQVQTGAVVNNVITNNVGHALMNNECVGFELGPNTTLGNGVN